MRIHLLFLCLAITLLSATCDKNNNAKEPKGNDKASIKWEKLLGNSQCAQHSPLQELTLTQNAFDQFWNQLFVDKDLSPEKPQIDFSKKAALFICLGQTNKGGHQVEVENITEQGTAYKVNLTHKIPGDHCMNTMAIEFPFIIVAIDKGKAEKADFIISKKVVDCK